LFGCGSGALLAALVLNAQTAPPSQAVNPAAPPAAIRF
jgi:hypothetical protein